MWFIVCSPDVKSGSRLSYYGYLETSGLVVSSL